MWSVMKSGNLLTTFSNGYTDCAIQCPFGSMLDTLAHSYARRSDMHIACNTQCAPQGSTNIICTADRPIFPFNFRQPTTEWSAQQKEDLVLFDFRHLTNPVDCIACRLNACTYGDDDLRPAGTPTGHTRAQRREAVRPTVWAHECRRLKCVVFGCAHAGPNASKTALAHILPPLHIQYSRTVNCECVKINHKFQ